MTGTQQFLPIEDIKDDLVFLKDGSVSAIITTSAVNFELLFETEQISIIQSFAGLLNSLSFPIQIIIRSKRLDVSSYLTTLDKAAALQTNPLLRNMISNYRRFAESIIKENNVLDKQFYICINVTSTELWILPKNIKDKTKKALTILNPRMDHILKQLAKLGLKSKQLATPELVKLFYDVYNNGTVENIPASQTYPTVNQAAQAFALRRLPQIPVKQTPAAYYPSKPQGDQAPQFQTAPAPAASNNPYQPPISPRSAPPFVVEELPDEYGP